MALSKTDIANQSLGRVGAPPIMSLEDQDSKSAREVKLVFEQSVRELGRSAEWNCLKARANLAQSDVPAFGWSYSYLLPADFIRLVKLNGTTGDDYPGDEWEIEGLSLLTDEEEAKIQYIAYKDDSNVYDPLFVDALVVLIASKIAVPLRGGDYSEMAAGLRREYETVTLPRARQKDASERKRKRYDPTSECKWIWARHSSTNG